MSNATATAKPSDNEEIIELKRTRNAKTGSLGKGTSTEKPGLSKDVIFELLKEPRRRSALRFLDENGGEATLGEIADYIAAEENDKSVSQITSGERKRAYVALYQCHLPMMDDVNVIDFDRPRGNVELREKTDQLLPYLYFDPSRDHNDTHFESVKQMLRNLF